MKNPSDADADLSPDQNSLVPAIIATAFQLFLSASLITQKSHTNTTPFVFILIK